MNFETKRTTYIKNHTSINILTDLVKEKALSVRIQGKEYLVVMRTPGNEKELVAGICLSEGIINKKKDIFSIGICDGIKSNIATVIIKNKHLKTSKTLEHRSYISNTSCGICGKTTLAEIIKNIKPLKSNIIIKNTIILNKLLEFDKHQPLRKKTRATHCSIIYDKKFKILSSAEDVGRHNALDKAIGATLLNETLNNARVILISSRISYELVQKAARAKIPIIAAISRPTSLAVNLASKLNITLTSLGPEDGLMIFCNNHHLSY